LQDAVSSTEIDESSNEDNNQYEETVASRPEEIRQLGKAGWVKYDEMTVNGTPMHFYRKPKQF
jgi:hypothetical protein